MTKLRQKLQSSHSDVICALRYFLCFHSRGQHLRKFIRTKESVYIRKEFNSHRTGLGHQHGCRFIVLGHKYGRHDVMWKHIRELQQQLRRRLRKRHLKSEFALLQTLSRLFQLVQFVKCRLIFLELNCKRLQSSGKEEESRCLVSTSSSKREIRHFHVVVVQRRQRNVQKSVMHVQSCCFTNRTLSLFWRSRCRRRRRCLSSLLSLPLRGLFKLMLHETIRNNDFQRNTALQCWNNVETIWSNVATML